MLIGGGNTIPQTLRGALILLDMSCATCGALNKPIEHINIYNLPNVCQKTAHSSCKTDKAMVTLNTNCKLELFYFISLELSTDQYSLGLNYLSYYLIWQKYGHSEIKFWTNLYRLKSI